METDGHIKWLFNVIHLHWFLFIFIHLHSFFVHFPGISLGTSGVFVSFKDKIFHFVALSRTPKWGQFLVNLMVIYWWFPGDLTGKIMGQTHWKLRDKWWKSYGRHPFRSMIERFKEWWLSSGGLRWDVNPKPIHVRLVFLPPRTMRDLITLLVRTFHVLELKDDLWMTYGTMPGFWRGRWALLTISHPLGSESFERSKHWKMPIIMI